MRETIAAADLGQDMLSLVAPGKINAFYIAMLSVNTLFLIVAMPSVMGNCAAGRTEFDGRVGFMFGTFIKRICTIAWSLTAMAALAWYLQNGIDPSTVDPDMVYGDVAHRFLPNLFPGVLGIFIASLLAAVMSSCDSFMIASSGLFTENIYRVVKPDQSERHYLWVGRGVSLLVVIGGIVAAFLMPGVIQGLKVWYKVVPMMGIAFWMGLFWRRATVAGAWSSALAGFGFWFLVTQRSFAQWVATIPNAEAWKLVVPDGETVAINEPWQIVAYLGGGLAVGVLVSLVTPRVEEQRLDRFFALIRTPVSPGETIAEPCTLPETAETPARPVLIKCFGLEVPAPSITSIVGFLIGWGCVAGLIGGFVWFVQA